MRKNKTRLTTTTSTYKEIMSSNFKETALEWDIVKGRQVSSQGVPVKVVILVASSARSGSSFLGELISQQENQIYFYEPAYYLLKLAKDKNAKINGTDILHDMAYCNISSAYVSWLRSMPPNRTIQHSLTNSKCERSNRCLDAAKLNGVCRQASNRIIK
ncbi:hypothetical protein SK128_006126, partial [Halocaridina rubra]